MKELNLEHEWAPYSSLVPFHQVRELYQPLEDFCEQRVEALLPLLTMGTEAPGLVSILAATADYLSEMRVVPMGSFNFDLINRRRSRRVELVMGQVERVSSTGEKLSFSSITLTVFHGAQEGYTEATFVGEGWKSWLAQAKKMLRPEDLLP